MTRSIAPRCWELIAFVPDPEDRPGVDRAVLMKNGIAERCGHQHASLNDCVACNWRPDPWPYVCDLMACEVRAERRQEQARFPWAPERPLRQNGRRRPPLP